MTNKIGNWPLTETYNDVAYVQHPERPYIIAVFSRQAAGYNGAVKVIGEISRRVYEFQSNPALKIDLFLNGKKLFLVEQPFVFRGVTLVPLRAVADVVPGISLGWDAGTITIVSNLGGVKKQIMFSRGDEIVIIEGRSYLPVRNLCRMLDLDLEWDNEDMRVNILTGEAVNLS